MPMARCTTTRPTYCGASTIVLLLIPTVALILARWGLFIPLANIPLGTDVHNIELKPGKGGMLARSAGAYGTLTSRDGKYAIIKLPSGESRMVLTTCRATIGITSNGDHGLEKSGKAGRSRW